MSMGIAEPRGLVPERAGGGAEAAFYCPFSSRVSPWAESAQGTSVSWAREFNLCATDSDYQRLQDSRIGSLVARAFPSASREALQLGTDWTTLFCLLDDLIEADDRSIVRLRSRLSRALDAFRTGSAAPGDAFGRALADVRRRIHVLGGEVAVERFTSALETLFSAFLWETTNRLNAVCPSLDAYVPMREITVGLVPQLVLANLADSTRLSAASLAHPTVRRLTSISANVIGWTNDLFTLDRELGYGEFHNLVIVLMNEQDLPRAEAERAVRRRCNDAVRSFVELGARLPEVGDEGPALEGYVESMRSAMRGHLDWALETGRYKRPANAPRSSWRCDAG